MSVLAIFSTYSVNLFSSCQRSVLNRRYHCRVCTYTYYVQQYAHILCVGHVVVSERSVDETKLMLACDDGTVVNTLSLQHTIAITLAAVQ